MNRDQCDGCEYQNDVYQRCIGCGGTRYVPTKVEAARRAGRAEGLMTTRRMAELLREFIGEHDAAKGSAFGCRCGTCCRARELLSRAEEVGRE